MADEYLQGAPAYQSILLGPTRELSVGMSGRGSRVVMASLPQKSLERVVRAASGDPSDQQVLRAPPALLPALRAPPHSRPPRAGPAPGRPPRLPPVLGACGLGPACAGPSARLRAARPRHRTTSRAPLCGAAPGRGSMDLTGGRGSPCGGCKCRCSNAAAGLLPESLRGAPSLCPGCALGSCCGQSPSLQPWLCLQWTPKGTARCVCMPPVSCQNPSQAALC